MKTTESQVAGTRVLVVDDSRDAARMLKVLLKGEGYEVRTAFDGPEGVEAAKAFSPRIVLLDLTLPSMSGEEVARAIRGDSGLADCLLIALSGYGPEDHRGTFPFDCHLTKPVDPQALLKLLADMEGRDRGVQAITATGS